ncbi:thiamine pyrophosphate-dependent enzyme [Rhabdochlamydiaceae symbiont of Dictyostelium giganteum]|uniref:alpha-ketoacid dehydrogenase subunit alpha/beta n=1 Tax=Rhabdochlamydiaceae symbiont of Dictyostelium giganteum TaxID=3342349 RepID=UPI00384E2328
MIPAILSGYEESALPIKALQVALLTRYMDDKCFKLSRQNKGGTFQLSVAGHELVGAVAALHLIPGKDWGLPYYRDRAFAIGLGSSLTDLLGAFLARDVPHHSGGRMMPEHFVHAPLNLVCQSSCVGSQFLHAVGVAKALKLKNDTGVVYVSAGEGATSQGDFHEALNFSCLHKLGVIFTIQDNGWAISVPRAEQTAGGSIAKMARGYENLSLFEVDGCDIEALSSAYQEAVSLARRGEGPSLIIAQVPRMGAHSNSDDPLKYRDEACLQSEKAKDPLPRLESWLIQNNMLSSSEVEEIKKALFDKIEASAAVAEKIPFPSKSAATTGVFAKSPEIPLQDPLIEGESTVIVDALNHALDEEMEKDPFIIVFGEDVAHGKGGVFGVTRHLTAKHGVSRCFNSPLAESTVIGVALGMSLVKPFKPVVEIQFADYLWPGINQLFNEVSSFHYRSNGEFNAPLVIRMPYGGYIQGGPYHSQSIEAFLAHCPGLKIVIPSNASDAKRLLKAAILDPNPVIFLEHKGLYRQRVFCARKEPGKDDLLPIGKAHVVRAGSDVTFVGWGMMICMVSEIAETLSQEGISVEVIDLRTIAPLDSETILASVKKTGKLLIAHEASIFGGFGAEIAAQVGDLAFHYLDAPIKRVGGKHCPVPYCKDLEDEVLPQKKDLEFALRELALY